MGTFICYPLLTQEQAQYTYDGIRQWFKDNPDRGDCKTESFTVRRDHVKEDILKNSEKGATLQEDPINSNFKASLPPPEKPKRGKKPSKKTAKKAK